jgi:uncharacterized protein
MPVRSLNSSVFKWPSRRTVDKAVRSWAADVRQREPLLVGLAYFGSYARGDWGVGSDLDLLAVVEHCDESFERRSLSRDLSELPVQANLLIYTLTEWKAMEQEAGRFARMITGEAVWLFARAVLGVPGGADGSGEPGETGSLVAPHEDR